MVRLERSALPSVRCAHNQLLLIPAPTHHWFPSVTAEPWPGADGSLRVCPPSVAETVPWGQPRCLARRARGELPSDAGAGAGPLGGWEGAERAPGPGCGAGSKLGSCPHTGVMLPSTGLSHGRVLMPRREGWRESALQTPDLARLGMDGPGCGRRSRLLSRHSVFSAPPSYGGVGRRGACPHPRQPRPQGRHGSVSGAGTPGGGPNVRLQGLQAPTLSRSPASGLPGRLAFLLGHKHPAEC